MDKFTRATEVCYTLNNTWVQIIMRFDGFNQMLNCACAKFTDETAVIYDDNGFIRRVSYAKLYSAICRRVEELKNIDKNCVGVFERSGKKFIVDTFASVIAGKQTVLINHALDDVDLQRVVNYADVNILCTDENTDKVARKVKLSQTEISAADGEGDILFFTSGTTGNPRAAVLTPEKLCVAADSWQERAPYIRGEIVLDVVPIWHIYGFICNLLCVMTQGATVAFNRGANFLCADLRYFNPSVVAVTPMILKRLLDKNAFNKNLRLVLVGAGLADYDDIERAEELSCKVQVAYGLTEISGGLACSADRNQTLLNVCSNCKVAVGDDGEILVKSESVMKGYYKLPRDTEDTLFDGVLYTGDVGEMENGKLNIYGRKNEFLEIGGETVFLPKLEAQIKEVMLVDDVAVVKRGDSLTAVCVDISGKRTVRELQKKLCCFNKSQPQNLEIKNINLRTVALPRNAIGKIKRWLI